MWFRKVYRPFITHIARIAQEEGVDLMAVGSEYRNSEVQVKEWNKTIDAVKSIYYGRLTYIANHDVSIAHLACVLWKVGKARSTVLTFCCTCTVVSQVQIVGSSGLHFDIGVLPADGRCSRSVAVAQ